MNPLARLLDPSGDPSGQAGDRLVAFGREGERSLADLRRDVASLAARLDAERVRTLALHCDDAYAFAVGLFATAAVRARVLLPPSRQPGALERVAGEVDAVLIDADDVLGAEPAEFPLGALDRDATLATLFTSGTTGSGSRVGKALRHLEDEVVVLEQLFGAQLGADARVLASVAPQHLYGLLFRVLWPLASGRPFLRSAALHPEELLPHADDDTPFAVVATPVALRRWAGRDAPVAAHCRAVFSSGGPLPADVARGVAASLGATPWEIYGSTETGGVAVRQQQRGGEPWRPMPGVELSVDAASGCLVVASPFVSVGDGRFATADRVAFDTGGGFALRGRADRVVKVGEKRLALAEMEDRLAEHPAVAEAALVALPQAGGETRVGAVLVPDPSAWDTLVTGGRRALTKVLAEHLSPDFERVFLPRAWRLVGELPRNAQGKLPTDRLLALFENDPPPGVAERVSVERRGDALDVHLRIPFDLSFLDGHYPSFPIVPGVAQVHIAMGALEELLGEAPDVERLEALKFHALLRPGHEARLRVSLDREGGRFRFSLANAADEKQVFSSGRGRLRAR